MAAASPPPRNPETLSQIYSAIHALSPSPDRIEDNLEKIKVLSKQINALNSDDVPKELREGIAQVQQQDPKNTFEIVKKILALQNSIPNPSLQQLQQAQQAQVELKEKEEKERADIKPQGERAKAVPKKQEILQRLNEQQCAVCAKEINDLLAKVDVFDVRGTREQFEEIKDIINILEKNGLNLSELKHLLSKSFFNAVDALEYSLTHRDYLDEFEEKGNATEVFKEKTREFFENRSGFPDKFQDGIAKFLESTAKELAKMPKTPDKNVNEAIIKLQVMIHKHLENPEAAPFREALYKLRGSLPRFLSIQQEAQQQRANKKNQAPELNQTYSKALAEVTNLLKTEISNFSKIYRPLNSSLKDFGNPFAKWANNAEDRPSLQDLEMLLRQERVDLSKFDLLDLLCDVSIKNLEEVVPLAKMLIEKFHQDASYIYFPSFEALFHLDKPPLSLESLIPGTLTFKEDVRNRPAAQLVELFIKNGFRSEPDLTDNRKDRLKDDLLVILLTQKFHLLDSNWRRDLVFIANIADSSLPLEDLVYMGIDFPFPDYSRFQNREGGWMKEIAENFPDELLQWHKEQAKAWSEGKIVTPESVKGKEGFADLMNRHMLPKLGQYFTFLKNRKIAENQLREELASRLIEVTGMARDAAKIVASYEEPSRVEIYKRCKVMSVKAQQQQLPQQ